MIAYALIVVLVAVAITCFVLWRRHVDATRRIRRSGYRRRSDEPGADDRG